MQQGERDGCAGSGSFVPQPVWQRQLEFGWAWEHSSSWACCAAHLLLMCSCVLLPWWCCCAVIHHLLWHLWELLLCCRGAMAAVDRTWGAEQGHPQPVSIPTSHWWPGWRLSHHPLSNVTPFLQHIPKYEAVYGESNSPAAERGRFESFPNHLPNPTASAAEEATGHSPASSSPRMWTPGQCRRQPNQS